MCLDVGPVIARETVTFTTPHHAFTLALDVDPRFGPRRPADLLVEIEVEAPGADPVIRTDAGFDLRSPATLLRDLGVEGLTDAEKVRAIAGFVHQAIYHGSVTGKTASTDRKWLQWRSRSPRRAEPERLDWFGLVRSVGAGLCGRQTGIAHGLFCAAGLASRVWRIKAPPGGPSTGHIVNEVFFDGVWRHVDVSYRGVYLNPRGAVASMEELAADRALIDRDPAYADEEVGYWAIDVSQEAFHELLVSYYASPETNTIGWDSERRATESPPPAPRPLRHRERRACRWGTPPERWGDVVSVNPNFARRDPYHAAASHRGAFGEIGRAWPVDLAAAPVEAHSIAGLVASAAADADARLVKPAGRGEGHVAYLLATPNLHTALTVSGAVDLAAGGAAEVALSFDRGDSYETFGTLTDGSFAIDLDGAVTGRTDVVVMVRLAGPETAAIAALNVCAAELANPRGFPQLAPGTNEVAWADDGPPGPRALRCTYVRDVSLAFAPDAPRMGDTVEITGRIRNRGAATARAVPVELRLDDPFAGRLIASRTVDAIAADDAAEFAAAWDTAGQFGAFDVFLVVDPERASRAPDRLVARRSIVVRRGPRLHVPPSFLRRDGDDVVLTIAAQGDADATDVVVQFFAGAPRDDAAPFDEQRVDRIARATHTEVRCHPPAGAPNVGARVILDDWAWTLGTGGTDAAPRRLTERPDCRVVVEPAADGAACPGAGALLDGDLTTVTSWAPAPTSPVVISITWDDAVSVGRVVVRYGDFDTALPNGAERFEILTDGGWRPIGQHRRVDGGIFSEHWLAPAIGRGVRLVVEGPARCGTDVAIRDLRVEERAASGVQPWPPCSPAPDRAVQ